ncbi:MAG: PQQ-dependent sugar dehydrogenase [Gemmatimonadetes bacterium]|nr:PQQ-dependent sugar dehydrogenase [Gemmatimonadota bacterium]
MRVVAGVVLVGLPSARSMVAQTGPACASDNAGLTVPAGFCVVIVTDQAARARHLTVAPNGDVLVAIARGQNADGGVLVLRDTNGDGVADLERRFGAGAGSQVLLHGGHLLYSTTDAVLRYPWREGAMEPAGPADTVVQGLPGDRSHRAKTIAVGTGNALYVNIGSPSNSCQQTDRTASSPGKDPCEELETRAGIWRFDATRTNQRQTDGTRFATGMRNSVAIAIRPQDGELYAGIHGRDMLFQNWGALGFDEAAGAEKPAEEFVRVRQGDDYGWPYCYYDPQLKQKVLAPEYGGDGQKQDRCAEKKGPMIGFPGHWAPNGLLFYSGTQFPERYRGGAFIAFHGSWNRAPLPQGGYNVVFAPFRGNAPTGEWEVFADGFAGPNKDPGGAAHRPVGLAQGPDGSVYVSDDRGGRIYRILYRGTR